MPTDVAARPHPTVVADPVTADPATADPATAFHRFAALAEGPRRNGCRRS